MRTYFTAGTQDRGYAAQERRFARAHFGYVQYTQVWPYGGDGFGF